MRFKKNDVIELEITDITNLGFGVGRCDGAVIFVSGAVTGDLIDARIIKVGSSFSVARVERYKRLSDKRCNDRCHIGACKSCAYKSVSYEYEKLLKRESVVSAFVKAGLAEVDIGELVGSPSEKGYRNKAQYPIAKTKDGEYVIGFYAPKSHRVTEAADCPLSPKVFPEILNTLRAFFKKYSLSVYDEESGNGLLRHVYLRRGEVSGEVLITLVINGTSLSHSDELVATLTKEFPCTVGILLNVNRESTNVVLGDEYITLFGRDYILDTLSGVKLKITAPSFYQVNHDAAELLYAKARELASLSKEDFLIDLYCGAGSIGLSMAEDCRELIGIEIVESAVECAKFNAQNNGISNAAFYTGDAKDTEGLLAGAERKRGGKIKADVVILDPPRAGSDEVLLSYITDKLMPKRIVYISCNPTTLARDCAFLNKHGYEIGMVTPFDLFSGTGHVESVVALTRRLDNELQPCGCVN